MMNQPVRSMPDFESARSGLYAGAIMGAIATALLGSVMLMAIIDSIRGLSSPWGMSITSLAVAGGCSVGATVFGLLGLSAFRKLWRWRRINERPIMAWATLGEPRRTGSRVNRRLLFDIPLTVVPPQGAPYAAIARWFVPHDVRDSARESARVVVRIDPEDPNVVLVDWDQTRAMWGLPPPPP